MSIDSRLKTARWCTLLGFFGLVALLLNWHTWLSPPKEFPRAVLLIVLVLPLMLPMRGLLHGKPYTHAWTSFLALPYFALGIDIAYTNETDKVLGFAQIAFSSLLFFGCVYYPRYRRLANQTDES
ncbi:MAG: DUF2069 domain-containing protein [Pseudomonadota bacterium]